jgi:aldehyde dehydrogenase (NAD+)
MLANKTRELFKKSSLQSRYCKSFSKKAKLNTQLFINNKFVNSKSGKTFPTFNPATEQLLANVQEAEHEDVDLAVKAARQAFDEGPWRRMSGMERGRLLFRLAELVEKNKDELSYLESLNNGKPWHIAKRADLNGAINMLRYFAGFCDKVHGQTIPVNGPFFVYTRHEPVGVCGQILPWNFPIAGVASKIAPALAMGCTIVLKPAEQTPLTALKIGELIQEAGFPQGVINIVPGFGQITGQALISHPQVDKIAFTGSTEIGLHIMKNSHGNGLKRVTLELGGKNANIIMDDADLDLAIKQAHGATFFNSGQICVQGSRLFVHEKIYDQFIEKSIELAKNKIIGDPLDEKTEQGPLVSEEQRKRFLYYVNKGISEGAKLHTGGRMVKDRKGYYVEPTVFSEVKDDMTIAKDEIFGPVMNILKFKTTEEVIQRANNSPYGLVGGVVTRSMEKALKVVNSLRTGTVYVNCYGFFDAAAPFGGYKNSGIGKEHGEAALKAYTEIKTVVIKKPEDSL